MTIEEEPDTVGSFLRQQLERKGLAITQLARLVGVRREHLGLIVNDRQVISIPLAVKIAEVLELNAYAVLEVQMRRRVYDYLRKHSLTPISNASGRFAKD